MDRFKVECITTDSENLTFGKEYKVIKSWKEKSDMKPYELYSVYLVVDDTGHESVEPCCLFKKIEKSNKEFNQNKKFNWYKFKKYKIAINCKTKEESENFLNYCNNKNIDITSFKDVRNTWEYNYKEEMCYEYKHDDLVFSSIEAYTQRGYKILDWSDYMNNENNQNKYDIEKTFKEVNNDIQEGETWAYYDEITITKTKGTTIIKGKSNYIEFGDNIKFKLQRNKTNFSDAFNEYENNNLEIESLETGYRYKKMIIDDVLCDCMYIINNGWKKIEEFDIYNFSLKEIRGEWYINK